MNLERTPLLIEAGLMKYRRRAFRKGATATDRAKLRHAVMGPYGLDARETGYIGSLKGPRETLQQKRERLSAHQARRGVKTKGR